MQTLQTEDFFKCIIYLFIYLFIYFILIFLACDILEKKRKEKVVLVYKGDGLLEKLLLQVSVFWCKVGASLSFCGKMGIPVSISRKGE